ncbi:hypothetical protein HDU96_005726 [Phlyctochytrium bullatum]|nr:hypothetical protein HDU96_005726 [Phlyctochytrium bullatum]
MASIMAAPTPSHPPPTTTAVVASTAPPSGSSASFDATAPAAPSQSGPALIDQLHQHLQPQPVVAQDSAAGGDEGAVTPRRRGPRPLPPEVWSHVAGHLHAMATPGAQRGLYGLCLTRTDIYAACIEWLWRAPVIDGFRQASQFLSGMESNLNHIKRRAAAQVVAFTTAEAASAASANLWTSPPSSVRGSVSTRPLRVSLSTQGGGGATAAASPLSPYLRTVSKTASLVSGTAGALRPLAWLIVSLERTVRNPEEWLMRVVPHAPGIVLPPQQFWSETILNMDEAEIERLVLDGFLRRKTTGDATGSTLISLALTASNRDKLLVVSRLLEKRAEIEKEEKAREERAKQARAAEEAAAAAAASAAAAAAAAAATSSSGSSGGWSAPLPRGPGRSSPTSAVAHPSGGSKTWGGFFGGSDTPAPPPSLASSSSSSASTSASSSFSVWPPPGFGPTRGYGATSDNVPGTRRGRPGTREEDPIVAENTTVERILDCLLPTDRKLAMLFPHFKDLQRLVLYERCITAAADGLLRVALLSCGERLRQIAIVGSAPGASGSTENLAGNEGTSTASTSSSSSSTGSRFSRLGFQCIWWGCPNLEELRVERVDLSSGREAGGGQGSTGSGGGMDWCGGSRSSPLSRPLIHTRPKLRRLALRDCVTPEAALLAEVLPLAPGLECLDLGNLTLSHPAKEWRSLWQSCLELSVVSKLPPSLRNLRVSWSPPCGVPLPEDMFVVLTRRCPRLMDLHLEGMARLPALETITGPPVMPGVNLVTVSTSPTSSPANNTSPNSIGLPTSPGLSATGGLSPSLSPASSPSYMITSSSSPVQPAGAGPSGAVSPAVQMVRSSQTPPGSPTLPRTSHALKGKSVPGVGGPVAASSAGLPPSRPRSLTSPGQYHPSPPSSPKLGARGLGSIQGSTTLLAGSGTTTPRPLLAGAAAGLGGSHGALHMVGGIAGAPGVTVTSPGSAPGSPAGLRKVMPGAAATGGMFGGMTMGGGGSLGNVAAVSGVAPRPSPLARSGSAGALLGTAGEAVVGAGVVAAGMGSASSLSVMVVKPPLSLRTLDLRFTSYLTDATVQTIAHSGLSSSLRHLLFRAEAGGGFTDAGLGSIAANLRLLRTLAIVPNCEQVMGHQQTSGQQQSLGGSSGNLLAASGTMSPALRSPSGSMVHLNALSGTSCLAVVTSRCTEVGLSKVVDELRLLRDFVPPVLNLAATPPGAAGTGLSPLSPNGGLGRGAGSSPGASAPGDERASQLQVSMAAARVKKFLSQLKRRGCRVWEPAEFLAASLGRKWDSSSLPASSPLSSPNSPPGGGLSFRATTAIPPPGAVAGGMVLPEEDESVKWGFVPPLETDAFVWSWGCGEGEPESVDGMRVRA